MKTYTEVLKTIADGKDLTGLSVFNKPLQHRQLY
jgi:hypothetical protein